MGKWDRRYYARPRRRNYQDYNWSPPRDEPCPDPETEVWQDNVPMWEKKFCYLVGRMPWKKVLSTRNFMHCHNNVVTWDDSAGEEAFNHAKKRFWDEFNGFPCETQPPNPDLYIDEIDWNPYIDPELVRELDREYFNPDDRYYLPSTRRSKENNDWPQSADDPWERGYTQSCTVQDKAAGWNQWDNSVDDTSKLTKANDPWERHYTQEPENKDKVGAWNNAWNSTGNVQTDTSKNWKAESNTWNSEGTGWPDRGACSRNWNQKPQEFVRPSYQNNNYRAQKFGSHLDSRVPNGRGNQWGQRHWDNYNSEVRGSGNVYRGRGRCSSGPKRKSPDDHPANFQSSRYRTADSNKRVSFRGQWS